VERQKHLVVERPGEKYLVMELDEGQRSTCGMLILSENQVAELILFLQTCGETWKAGSNPMEASHVVVPEKASSRPGGDGS
jgi:hypothetical protein